MKQDSELLRPKTVEVPSAPASGGVRHHRPSGRKGIPTRWTAAELASLQRAYYGPSLMKMIAYAFGTSDSTIHRFARQLGWKRRHRLRARVGGA